MAIKKALTDLPIKTSISGFYSGFSKHVTLPSKFIISMLILWAVVFPDQSGPILNAINAFILASFASWYIYVVAFFVVVCLGLALWPTAGRLNLGMPEDKPEFSNFSWFSMMFGAGIGVGMLTWSVAEPMYHISSNPEVIKGLVDGNTVENVRNAYKWSFLHWGLGAWACYAIAGLSLAFFSYRRGLPLTIRSALTPLFGKALSGNLGNVIDVIAVVATVLGVSQTLGFGVEQFVFGLYRIGAGEWLLNDAGTASNAAIVLAIFVIMLASTLSALSGVGKGIKWLSNINMGLSFFLLTFFLIFGATWFGATALFWGLIDYVIALPNMLIEVWRPDGTLAADGTVADTVANKLAGWQSSWSVFYWAWWVAFAPFVGLFLARISRGRTVREFVLGAMVIPSLMCFIWFTWAGGTAVDLELSGIAQGAISAASDGDKIFAIMPFLISSDILVWVMSLIIFILLMTYLVTTADSAVLIINTINAGGDEGPKARAHIIFWGVALAGVVGALLLVGGLNAIKTAMVIGALPFSIVMVLMCFSLIKAIYRDGLREKAGIATTFAATDIQI